MNTAIFQAAATALGDRAITVVPLILDESGLPKRPVTESYSRFRACDNTEHDWSVAAGIGIVLGEASNGLAVVDVDDIGLSEYLLKAGLAMPSPPMMVRSARGKLHIYVQEPRPFTRGWQDLAVSYQGRRCLTQLLATSYCQVTAPPTPGYSWVNPPAMPLFGSIFDMWKRISITAGCYSRPATRWDFAPHQRSNNYNTRRLRDMAR